MRVRSFSTDNLSFDVEMPDGRTVARHPWMELRDVRERIVASGPNPGIVADLAEIGAACDAAHGEAARASKMADAEYRAWAGRMAADLRQPVDTGEEYKSGPRKGQAKFAKPAADEVKAMIEADDAFLDHKRAIGRAEAILQTYAGMSRRITALINALQGTVESQRMAPPRIEAAPMLPPVAAAPPSSDSFGDDGWDDQDLGDSPDW